MDLGPSCLEKGHQMFLLWSLKKESHEEAENYKPVSAAAMGDKEVVPAE